MFEVCLLEVYNVSPPPQLFPGLLLFSEILSNDRNLIYCLKLLSLLK